MLNKKYKMLIVAFLLIVGSVFADRSLESLVPRDSSAYGVLDVQGLLAAPVVKDFLNQYKALQGQDLLQEFNKEMTKEIGSQVEDIKEMCFFTMETEAGSDKTPYGMLIKIKDLNSSLVLTKIRENAKGNSSYKGIDYFIDEEKNTIMIQKDILIFCNSIRMMEKSIETLQGAPGILTNKKLSGSLVTERSKVMYGGGEIPPSALKDAEAPINDIQSLIFSLDTSSKIDLLIDLKLSNAENANAIALLITMSIAQIKAQFASQSQEQKVPPVIENFTSSIKTRAKDNACKITFSATGDEFKEYIGFLMMLGLSSQMAPNSAPKQ